MDILQWNINGYFKRLENIKLLVNHTWPTCICFQETNFSSNYCAFMSGYEKFYRNRTQSGRASGGVVIYIKPHTIPEEIKLNTNLEAIAIKIKFPFSITMCNIYIPNSHRLDKQEFNKLIEQLPKPYIILGDFNSHHFYWGSNKCDSRGKIIAEWLDENDNVALLNNGQPTHFDSNTGRTSNIDLSMASQNIMSYFEWNALDDLYDSDHFPILIKSQISNDNVPENIKVPQKWKTDKANWIMFSEEINKYITELPALNIDTPKYSVNEYLEKFTEVILKAAQKSIPKTFGILRKNNLPWWTDECKTATKETKKAFKLFKRYARNEPNSNYKIDYKKKRAYCRRLVKENRKKYWENWVSSINNNTLVGDIWKKIQKLSHRNTKFNNIVLEKNNGSFTSNPVEISNLLAKTFATNSSSENYDPKFLDNKNYQETYSNFNITENSNPINDDITLHELIQVITQSKNSSPGPDNIPNIIIKHLPARALEYLLQLYNFVYKKQVFPDSWREALVIPILKPGKIPSLQSSYRPISLTCNMCKILEKIISKRIRWYVETNKYLSAFQYGFRQYRSTTDYLINIESEILDSFANSNYSVVVALDIEKAYEMVWKHRVLKLLQNINIVGNTLAFVRNFLSSRTMKVRINDYMSDPVPIENGLPQGSVLSVILFLVAINDVLNNIEKPVKGFLFADDLTIICSGGTLCPTLKLIQNTLNNLQEWSERVGFKFSKTKTEFMIFTNKRKVFRNTQLTLNNHSIKEVSNLKILGLIFDKKLSWNTHINNLKSECYKRLNIIKSLSSTGWGSEKSCLINIYRTLIRQKIDYGCIIYDSAKKRTLNSLESIQNTALRLSIGGFRTSPIKCILVEAGEMPLEFRRKQLILTYVTNILTQPENPTYHYYTKVTAVDTEYELQPNLSQPLRIRAVKYLDELNLKIPKLFTKKLLTSGPWENLELPVNLELANYKKGDTPQCIYKNLFCEINDRYRGYKIYYTDGSVKDGHSGCSVVSANNYYRYRLVNFNSIFSCEGIAILKALELIHSQPNTDKYIIYTDSKSCLTALKNLNNLNNLILEIKQKMVDLLKDSYKFEIIWIPSHQGIAGNEKADQEAKNATSDFEEVQLIISTASDVQKHLKFKIKTLWDHHWKFENTSFLFKIRNSIFDKLSFSLTKRKDQVVLTRLRIGHTNLTHIHLITKTDKNKCKCGLDQTVVHLLVECKAYDIERQFCKLPDNLTDCLTQDGYKQTLSFLKIIGLYNLV